MLETVTHVIAVSTRKTGACEARRKHLQVYRQFKASPNPYGRTSYTTFVVDYMFREKFKAENGEPFCKVSVPHDTKNEGGSVTADEFWTNSDLKEWNKLVEKAKTHSGL